jgi:hypothetical protein
VLIAERIGELARRLHDFEAKLWPILGVRCEDVVGDFEPHRCAAGTGPARSNTTAPITCLAPPSAITSGTLE